MLCLCYIPQLLILQPSLNISLGLDSVLSAEDIGEDQQLFLKELRLQAWSPGAVPFCGRTNWGQREDLCPPGHHICSLPRRTLRPSDAENDSKTWRTI